MEGIARSEGTSVSEILRTLVQAVSVEKRTVEVNVLTLKSKDAGYTLAGGGVFAEVNQFNSAA